MSAFAYAPKTVEEREAPTPEPPVPGGGPLRRKPIRRWRRRVLVGLLVLLIVPGWSYAHALTAPGSAPIANRSVEWIRDHGGASLVDAAEQWNYSRRPVSTKTLAQSGVVLPAAPLPTPAKAKSPSATGGLPAPPDISAAAAGGGQWQPVGRTVNGRPALSTTSFRPFPDYPGVVVGAAWVDTTLVRSALVAGTATPGGTGWAWGSSIPASERPGLLAAFNSGFRFQDTAGGFYAEGRQPIPLVDGQASFIVRSDGSATVGQWGRDAQLGPTITAVRQNLKLIVDGGQPVPGLTTNATGAFGARRQQLQYTWRSAVGVDPNGALVYVSGKNLTLAMLADALVEAGAVRGMQLDIHTNNVTFNLYQPSPQPSGVTAAKLTPDMARPATRYLQPDQRDFIALTLK
jgi:hypothetical protein